jgi:hypothetical protein
MLYEMIHGYEFERLWKEAVIAKLKLPCLEGLRKCTNHLIQDS